MSRKKIISISVIAVIIVACMITIVCINKNANKTQDAGQVEATETVKAPAEVAEVAEETEEKNTEAAEVTEAVEATEEAEATETTESSEPAAASTVTPMEPATFYATRSLNVRKGAGTEFEKVGTLSTGEAVTVTGRDASGWYEISYNDGKGYVSDSYISETKPTASAAKDSSASGSATSNASSASAASTPAATQTPAASTDNVQRGVGVIGDPGWHPEIADEEPQAPNSDGISSKSIGEIEKERYGLQPGDSIEVIERDSWGGESKVTISVDENGEVNREYHD